MKTSKLAVVLTGVVLSSLLGAVLASPQSNRACTEQFYAVQSMLGPILVRKGLSPIDEFVEVSSERMENIPTWSEIWTNCVRISADESFSTL